jgi:DNA-binding NtrC family response regulator
MKSAERKPRILIVDDDKNTRDGLDRALRGNYLVSTAESGERALELMGEARPDILLADVRMPGMDGLTLMRKAIARQPGLICMLLTAYGNVETAVEAMKHGARDFLTKPVNLDHLEILLHRALQTREMERENANLHEQLDQQFGLSNLVGSSPPMQQLFDTIRQAAPTQANVLIQGESGTGKELVAHAIHRLSTRAKGPFVTVHCAALSPTLLESELFGHEKGAFTGAAFLRRGRFEIANGGTLFLDEVSEIDPAIQVKLLRIIEERTFERVGGNEPMDTDIRLVAATNRNLKALVSEGKFREDLFFRLDVVNIVLPPLRQRGEDIPVLAHHFLAEFNEKNHKKIECITNDALQMLNRYQWPGNVRELRNTIEKMVVMSRNDRLTARDIPAAIRESAGTAPGTPATANTSLADTERDMILRALKRHDDNRTLAARELGISRRTLHRKLNQYKAEGISV